MPVNAQMAFSEKGGLASITAGPTERQADGTQTGKAENHCNRGGPEGSMPCDSNPRWLDDPKSKQPFSSLLGAPKKVIVEEKGS